MNNQVDRYSNTKFIGYSTVIIAAICIFLLPYAKYFSHVGSFPSENLSDGTPDSHYKKILCIENTLPPKLNNIRPNEIFFSRSSFDYSTSEYLTDIPHLMLTNDWLAQNNKFENSNSLYFPKYRKEILPLDKLEEKDVQFLQSLVAQGLTTVQELDIFIEQTRRYYATCSAHQSDSGIAEGYWAAKGTSVLHHWVHLYESNLQGDVHGQYGYLVSWGAHSLLGLTSQLGPTNFVRLAWIFYAICGLAYIALFLFLFRDHLALAISALFTKLFFLSKIGIFMLVLAPGYHWFRELVLVAVPAILLTIGSYYVYSNPKRNILLFVFTSLLFAICYSIDPIFFLISIASALLAWLWANGRLVGNYFKLHSAQLSTLLLLLLVVMAVAVFYQTSNLHYVADKLLNLNLGAEKYIKRVAITSLIALSFLIFGLFRRQYFLANYFAFITLFSSLYYLITPDSFHFYKFGEYALPFIVIFIIFLAKQFHSELSNLSIKFRLWFKVVAFAIAIALISATVLNLFFIPPSPEFRLRDSSGNPYFISKSFTINNRLINANMSENLVEHLKSFPVSTNSDFIVSPYDKYLSFLYDRSNGLGTPDLIPSLDADEKIDAVLDTIFKQGGSQTILLDTLILHVDTRQGIKMDNAALGKQHEISKFNLKARLRAAELANFLLVNCATLNDEHAKGRWILLQCSHGIR